MKTIKTFEEYNPETHKKIIDELEFVSGKKAQRIIDTSFKTHARLIDDEFYVFKIISKPYYKFFKDLYNKKFFIKIKDVKISGDNLPILTLYPDIDCKIPINFVDENKEIINPFEKKELYGIDPNTPIQQHPEEENEIPDVGFRFENGVIKVDVGEKKIKVVDKTVIFTTMQTLLHIIPPYPKNTEDLSNRVDLATDTRGAKMISKYFKFYGFDVPTSIIPRI